MSNSEPVYQAGFVAIIGRPNVGKSTLVNAFLGQKIAAVSPRPQTTRRRQLGILSLERAQIIFIDTPGIHKPHHKLGEFMNEEAIATLEDADLLVWLVDASAPPTEEDQLISKRLLALAQPPAFILALNKIDLVNGDQLDARQAEFVALLPSAEVHRLSATQGQGRDTLFNAILAHMPEGQPFYPEEEVTDFYEREISADLIREAALIHLRDEIPHGIAVRIDEYKERGENGAHITATLLIERESHKGIIIGQGGEMLKKIGSTARQEIETMSGRKIYLELRVKVNANWRDNPDTLRTIGYFHKKE